MITKWNKLNGHQSPHHLSLLSWNMSSFDKLIMARSSAPLYHVTGMPRLITGKQITTPNPLPASSTLPHLLYKTLLYTFTPIKDNNTKSVSMTRKYYSRGSHATHGNTTKKNWSQMPHSSRKAIIKVKQLALQSELLRQFREVPWNQTTDVHQVSTLIKRVITWRWHYIVWRWRHRTMLTQ